MRRPLSAATTAVVLGSALLLAACGPSDPPAEGGNTPADSTEPTDAEESDVAFTNPVYDSNFPDPFVLRADDHWYAYATQGTFGTFPILRSEDLVTWSVVGNGMPTLAPWTAAGRHWAPEVAKIGDRYLAYYTAMERETQQQCLGVAVSDSPEGPFVDESEEPFICQFDEGGSIDASPFIDADGTPYLMWKNDGNHIGTRSWIYIQELAEDGLSLVGDEPTSLITHDQDWEGDLVEGPFLWPRDGRYYLFYSANDYGSDAYGVSYAVAEDLLGPYTKPAEEPLMSSNDVAAGPGHGMVVETEGGTWYVHHSWPPDAVGSAVPGRQMWLTPLTWTEDGTPVLAEPAHDVETQP
ncbi:glycoside hydrolase family 43 protein [Ruania zhangjianzhongii]|uniref:glycoside hydrolase family 43 protein n=1 Tax=Ruania zhangjianzhongii TaxID=2603206 RepID=UPI0011C94A36|nr:glycoside hydrolase family 43 protein [Ruania zhangjianzhongii]